MSAKKIGDFAAVQALAEIGIGSVLHAFHIPLGGHFLSLNQIFLLTLGVRTEQRRKEAVSFLSGTGAVVAVLKSLSPAGKRVTPMLAIAQQGFLYATGVAILGPNPIGALLGGALSSLWAFIQPLLLAALFLGTSFFTALHETWIHLSNTFHLDPKLGPQFLIAIVFAKLLLTNAIVIFAWKAPGSFHNQYLLWLQSRISPKEPNKTKNAKRSISPWIIVSFLFTLFFFALSKERDLPHLFWIVFRFLGITWLFFWLSTRIPLTVLIWLEKTFPTLNQALKHARHQIDRSRSVTKS